MRDDDTGIRSAICRITSIAWTVSSKAGCGTYNVRAGVVEKLPPEPMLAAAIICTAQPQSIDATEAIEPMVFASGAI